MKSPSPKGKQKRSGKAPKARVMWTLYCEGIETLTLSSKHLRVSPQYPAAVLPTETAKQAKALVAFANLSEDGKILAVAERIDGGAFYENPSARHVHCSPNSVAYCQNNAKATARAILQATGHISGRGK